MFEFFTLHFVLLGSLVDPLTMSSNPVSTLVQSLTLMAESTLLDEQLRQLVTVFSDSLQKLKENSDFIKRLESFFESCRSSLDDDDDDDALLLITLPQTIDSWASIWKSAMTAEHAAAGLHFFRHYISFMSSS